MANLAYGVPEVIHKISLKGIAHPVEDGFVGRLLFDANESANARFGRNDRYCGFWLPLSVAADGEVAELTFDDLAFFGKWGLPGSGNGTIALVDNYRKRLNPEDFQPFYVATRQTTSGPEKMYAMPVSEMVLGTEKSAVLEAIVSSLNEVRGPLVDLFETVQYGRGALLTKNRSLRALGQRLPRSYNEEISQAAGGEILYLKADRKILDDLESGSVSQRYRS